MPAAPRRLPSRVLSTAVIAALVASLTAVVGTTGAHGATLPGGFVEEVVASDSLNSITGIDFLPDGRLLVTEKRGRIKIISETNPSVSSTVLNIQDSVNTAGDRGLLGIAVDPDFATTERVFLSYTYDPPETLDPAPYWDGNASATRSLLNGQKDKNGQRLSRVSSWQLDPSTNYTSVVPGSENVVLGEAGTWETIGDPFALQTNSEVPWACNTYAPGAGWDEGEPIEDCVPNDGVSHQIGGVEIGPDGYLWVTTGDSANYSDVDIRALRSLDPEQLVGKVIRIDKVTGKGAPDNPGYEGDGSSNRSRTWAQGLRQPFRFTFDGDGTPYIGDVGWDRYEELNIGAPGASFGWPCFEGGLSEADIAAGVTEGPGVTVVQPGYGSLPECAAFDAADQTAPARTWCHGPVNPGVCPDGGASAVASVYYPGGEYPSEFEGIWYGDVIKGWMRVFHPSDGTTTWFSGSLIVPVDLAIGPDGNVYIASRMLDQVVRIRYTDTTNQQPSASATADVVNGTAPLEVNFDGSASSDPDGTIVSYDWDFGDGSSDTGATPTHTYTTDGTFVATLTVTDDLGAQASADVTIDVGNLAPVVTITSPADGAVYDIGSVLNFTGSATDPEDGPIPDVDLSWAGTLHHNDHIHEDEFAGTGGAPEPYAFEDHADDTYIEVCLTATDSDGLEGSTCIDVFPTEVDYTFETTPGGLDVNYSGQQLTTPVTVRVAAGVDRTIDAPADQGGYSFADWSIGGPRTQVITTEFTDQTVTADYDVPTEAGPKPFFGELTAVDGTWQTVALPEPYVDPVVVATPRYANGQAGAVTRVRNVSSTSFEVKLQAPSGTTPTHDVEYFVIEKGRFTAAEDGIEAEAGVVTSGITDHGPDTWVGQSITNDGFATPIVTGQVMTENDADWSTFWAGSSGRYNPPGATIRIGKHVGEDPDTTRADEEVGYVVMEAGAWDVGDTTIVAGRTPAAVVGEANFAPYAHSLGFLATNAVATQTTTRGGDGSWAVLVEDEADIGTEIDLMVDEDRVFDTERLHGAEIVDYVAAETTAVPVIAPGLVNVPEGDTGSTTAEFPVMLSAPTTRTVTVDFTAVAFPGTSWVAIPGVDHADATGTITIPPGQTTGSASIEVYGDTDVEAVTEYFLGARHEWAWFHLSNPTNATVNTSFFGLGAVIIADDD